MALKRKITKDVYEKLADNLKFEYKADGEGFILETEGDEDTGALKRAKDRETQRATKLQEQLDDANAKLADGETLDARKRGDIASLEASWQGKLTKQKNEMQGIIDTRETFIKGHLVDSVASTLAAKLAPKSPTLLLPHIKQRLAADLESATPATKVLGVDGKPSALTLADLEAEFVANKDFSAIITVSKASGSGGTPTPTKPGGSANGEQQATMLSTMKPDELVAFLKERKAAAAT